MYKRIQYLLLSTLLMVGASIGQAQIKGASNNEAYMVPDKPEDISPLLIGEKVPVIKLPDPQGKMMDVNGLIAEQPTVLVFYRGGWCPYCSRQLSGLQEIKAELDEMGYRLIAISTDSPENLTESMSSEKLDYTLLSDADLEVSKKFGLAYKAPDNYHRFLPETSGGKNKDKLLPVPSIFIIDKKGTIQFEYINPDFKERMDPDILMSVANVLAMREE